MDRYRMYRLAATERKFAASKGGAAFLSATTFAVVLLSVLFYVFLMLSGVYGEQTPEVLAYLPVSICVLFVVAMIVYFFLRSRTSVIGYASTMYYFAFCYAICAAAGYLILRNVWVWGSELEEVARFEPMLTHAALFSLLAPVLVVLFYVGLCFIKANSPVSRWGSLYPLHGVVPLLIVGCVLIVIRAEEQPALSYRAREAIFLYLCVMLAFSARFLFKGILYRLAGEFVPEEKDLDAMAARIDQVTQRLWEKPREKKSEPISFPESFSDPDLGEDQELLTRPDDNPNLPLIFTNHASLSTITEKASTVVGGGRRRRKKKNKNAGKRPAAQTAPPAKKPAPPQEPDTNGAIGTDEAPLAIITHEFGPPAEPPGKKKYKKPADAPARKRDNQKTPQEDNVVDESAGDTPQKSPGAQEHGTEHKPAPPARSQDQEAERKTSRPAGEETSSHGIAEMEPPASVSTQDSAPALSPKKEGNGPSTSSSKKKYKKPADAPARKRDTQKAPAEDIQAAGVVDDGTQKDLGTQEAGQEPEIAASAHDTAHRRKPAALSPAEGEASSSRDEDESVDSGSPAKNRETALGPRKTVEEKPSTPGKKKYKKPADVPARKRDIQKAPAEDIQAADGADNGAQKSPGGQENGQEPMAENARPSATAEPSADAVIPSSENNPSNESLPTDGDHPADPIPVEEVGAPASLPGQPTPDAEAPTETILPDNAQVADPGEIVLSRAYTSKSVYKSNGSSKRNRRGPKKR